jgi:hypothetical protein
MKLAKEIAKRAIAAFRKKNLAILAGSLFFIFKWVIKLKKNYFNGQ